MKTITLEQNSNDTMIAVNEGGLTLGTLSPEDMENSYGSAASTDYRPFISDIRNTYSRTSRLIRNRSVAEAFVCRMFFYVNTLIYAGFA